MRDLITAEWRQQQQQPLTTTTTPPHSQPIVAPGASNPISISAPASFSSLGRSLDELRLHNTQASSSTSSDNDSGNNRFVSDADVDSSSSFQGVSFRGFDGPQSLPSLKASGLLDSWNWLSAPGGSAAATWVTGRSEPNNHRPSPPPPPPPRIKTPTTLPLPFVDTSRTSSSGMPVGLPWLANESRS